MYMGAYVEEGTYWRNTAAKKIITKEQLICFSQLCKLPTKKKQPCSHSNFIKMYEIYRT